MQRIRKLASTGLCLGVLFCLGCTVTIKDGDDDSEDGADEDAGPRASANDDSTDGATDAGPEGGASVSDDAIDVDDAGGGVRDPESDGGEGADAEAPNEAEAGTWPEEESDGGAGVAGDSGLYEGDSGDAAVMTGPVIDEVVSIGVGVGGDTFCSDGSFTVTIQPKDAEGRLVSPGQDDIECLAEIADDAVECRVEDVQCDLGGDVDQGRTTVLVIVDDSASMDYNDVSGLRKQACANFVQQLGDDDAVAVVDFGHGGTSPASALRTVQAFTTDKAAAATACESLGTGPVGTPIYGSVVDAASVFLPAARSEFGATATFSVLLLSDGEPAADTASREEAIAALEQDVFPIYTVGLGPAAEGFDTSSTTAIETLQELSQISGGAYASSGEAEGLDDLFTQVGSVVREGSCEVSARLVAGSFTTGEVVQGELLLQEGELTSAFGFNVPTTDLEQSICQ